MSAYSRVAPGVPAGGQFAADVKAEARGVELDLPDVGQSGGVSFAELAKEDRVEAMRAEIDSALDRMSDAEGWRDFLDSRARFHHYSLNNQLLIYVQKPDASAVAGFRSWQNEHERTVKKGEKAIWVLAPLTYTRVEKDAATGEEVKRTGLRGFRTVPVFDVSQTEGKDLPPNPVIEDKGLSGEAPEGMVAELSALIEADGFTVSRDDTGQADAYTDFTNKRVVVNPKFEPRYQARALAHEAAHIALGHGADGRKYHTGIGGQRDAMEVEADSAAYVISRAYGLDDIGDSSFSYIDGWAHGDRDKVRTTASKVCGATKTMLERLHTIRTGSQEATT